MKRAAHRALFARVNAPGVKGSNTVMWVVLALVVTCGGCTVLTGGLMFLGLFAPEDGFAPSAVSRPASTGTIPTGETPDLFPGMPGWLPSGRGVELPDAQLVDERPEGVWWRFQPNGSALVMVFLADGTRATNPRPGGGALFDLEGQRAQRGNTGVGTFSIDDGQIVQRYDGFETTDAFDSGSDGDGEWMKIGGAKYVPLHFVGEAELAGAWKANGSKFIFRTDGSYESGQIVGNGDFVANSVLRGRWTLDGYLLAVTPSDARGWVGTVGRWGSLLLINGTVYSRE